METNDPRPPSKLIRHGPGWTVFENLYMSNGTLYIITPDPGEWPDLRYFISVPMIALNTPENIAAREPTPELISFISRYQAERLWGDRIWDVKDFTFMVTDPPQFLNHYYHFVAETFLGLWRMFASLDPKIDAHGKSTLPKLGRIIVPYCSDDDWVNAGRAPFNQWFLQGVFPSIGIESSRDWNHRVSLTASPKGLSAFRFANVVLSDRSASFRGNLCPGRTNRIASEAYEVTTSTSSQWWWEPIRQSVLKLSRVEKSIMERSVMWDGVWKWGLDFVDKNPQTLELALKSTPIVISYIVRTNKRMLRPEDHKELVHGLRQLCASKGWQLNIVHAERMSKDEQVLMAAKTTIMLGVHGNGLTHLVWMSPSPLSTVIEMFYPGGFARDYEWTARALGHRHYAIRNDTYATYPNLPDVDYPEGFQGNSIPLYAPTVTKLIEDRLEGRI
ncbi:hypothetical protein FRB93_009743 [Tulasnella sp. JGI-2019a]|nr:hypothetical protein FRB93_009743 [Tulasnella sp. JGI-2019a]